MTPIHTKHVRKTDQTRISFLATIGSLTVERIFALEVIGNVVVRLFGWTQPLRAGTHKFGVRYNTVRCLACCAISGVAYSGSDHADPLGGEVDAVVRPMAGVILLALE
jgi:hypothetical protein